MHTCLVLELMGEPLVSFCGRFDNKWLPDYLTRRCLRQLIHALDYAHGVGFIHCDIKYDNILVKIRDHSLIEQYIADFRARTPPQDRTERAYKPIASLPLRRYYFNRVQACDPLGFDFVLADWGLSSIGALKNKLIQAASHRAPEVVLEAGYDDTTDWWNLGVVALHMFRHRILFCHSRPEADYSVREHLAEMVHHAGPIPRELLERGNPRIVQRYLKADGTVRGAPDVRREPLEWTTYLAGLEETDRMQFASFLRVMLAINPGDRGSAEDMLRHPWMNLEP